jgi:hypothetical protein
MNPRNRAALAWLFLVAGIVFAQAADAQVVSIAGSSTQAYFGSMNDTYQASSPAGFNPWPAAGPNPPIFYSTISQLPGVPNPPGGNTAPTNPTSFFPFNGTAFFNDGNGNSASSGISTFIAGNTGTADDAQIGLFMTLTQSTGGYAYEQINYVVDLNVSSLVNIYGTAGTIAGMVSRSYSVSGNIGGPVGFVAFGGEMNFWDGTTNTSLGAPLQFNYFNNQVGPFTATVNASSFITGVDFPNVLRITGNFFLIADPSTITVVSVPEPSGAALAAIAVVGLIGLRRRFKMAG